MDFSRPFTQLPFTLAAAGMEVKDITGPMNFFKLVGSSQGYPLEISINGGPFIVISPGERLSNMGTVERVSMRNPNNGAAVAVMVKFGIADVDVEDSVIRSMDGRHPLQGSRINNGAGDLFALLDWLNPISDRAEWAVSLKDLVAFNESANPAYIKIRWDNSVPQLGVDPPDMTFLVPAGGGGVLLSTTHGIRPYAAAGTVPWMWFAMNKEWDSANAAVGDKTLRVIWTVC